LFEEGETKARTVPLLIKGEWRYLQTSASPVRGNSGKVIAAMKWAVDVTEREQAYQLTLGAQNTNERLGSGSRPGAHAGLFSRPLV
jgi:hypothetical protein